MLPPIKMTPEKLAEQQKYTEMAKQKLAQELEADKREWQIKNAKFEKQLADEIASGKYDYSKLDGIPAELDRNQYEHYCKQFDFEPMTDVNTYAVKYGSYQLPSKILEQHLALRHLKYLEKHTVKNQSQKFDYPNGKPLDCGHVIYYKFHEMGTSHGSSCSNCYENGD